MKSLAAKVGDATQAPCRRCAQERVSYFYQDIGADAADDNGRTLVDVQATRPALCPCGQPFAYKDIVYVVVAA